MGDSQGSLRISYNDTDREGMNIVLDFGAVLSFAPTVTKMTGATPIVSRGIESTFVIESGGGIQYTLNFMRKLPKDADDSSEDPARWSNSYWWTKMTAAVSRLQARTDGFRLTYVPSDTNPYTVSTVCNGYIKNLTRTIDMTSVEVIRGTMTFIVGTMYVTNVRAGNETIEEKSSYIVISDVSGANWYALLNNFRNENYSFNERCVEKYYLHEGLQQPFPFVTMTMPKKALASAAQSLTEPGGIVPGKTRLRIRAYGEDTEMTVVKCKISKTTCTLTAFSDMEAIRGLVTPSTMTGTPLSILHTLFGQDKVVTVGTLNTCTANMTFAANTNVWYIAQICAMILGGAIFFRNGKCYIANCITVSSGDHADNVGALDLSTMDADHFMYARASDVTMGDEGTDTIINHIIVKCGDTVYDSNNDAHLLDTGARTLRDRSIADYGESTVTYTIPELSTLADYSSKLMAHVVKMRALPQFSVTFDCKEISSGNGGRKWISTFKPVTWASSIDDVSADIHVTNKRKFSDGSEGTYPQLLMCAEWVRNYPEGTSTYTFGKMCDVDLSASTSQILNALNR